jgi:hypothetical protein
LRAKAAALSVSITDASTSEVLFDRHEAFQTMTRKRTSTRARLGERLRIRLKQRTATSLACPDSPFWAHRYFTDGVKLYRFVGWVHRSVSGMLAEFEDCRSLDVLLVNIDSLGRTGLRPVVVPNGT